MMIGIAKNNLEVMQFLNSAKCVKEVVEINDDWVEFMYDENIESYECDTLEGRIPPPDQVFFDPESSPGSDVWVAYSKSFRGTLRKLRKAKRLSIPDLAALADMPRQTIHALERGERQPSLATAERLAKALGKKLRVFEGCGITNGVDAPTRNRRR